MKVCIIGAGAGGRSASGRIRQLDQQAEIDVFSTQSEIGYAPCELPFVLRGGIVDWGDIFYPGNFFQQNRINLHLNTEVTEIVPDERRIATGGNDYSYDKLVLSTGAVPSIPPIPGLDGHHEYTLSTNIADGRAIEAVIPGYTTAAVVGAGAIGTEIALALVKQGYRQVYLVEMRENILPASLDKDMAAIIESTLPENGIELITSAMVKEITTENGQKRLILDGRELVVDLVFLATGARPNITLARNAGLHIGETGAIAVNQYLQTSNPDIYAAGDCMENWEVVTGTKTCRLMVTTATITGNLAATNLIQGNPTPYNGTALSFVIEIFGHQVGTVGLTEKLARQRGIDIVTSVTAAGSRRPKYGGTPVHCKLTADRGTQALLGAQIISREPVRGAIDELALALARRISLPELNQVDLPFSPACGGNQVSWTIRDLINKLDG